MRSTQKAKPSAALTVDDEERERREDLVHALDAARERWTEARAEQERLIVQQRETESALALARAQAAQFRADHERVCHELGALAANTRAEMLRLEGELHAARAVLATERAAAADTIANLIRERDAARHEREIIRAERDAFADQLSSRFVKAFQAVNRALRDRGIEPKRVANLIFGRR